MVDHDTTVLILPGIGNSGPEHWQSRWERSDSTCQRVTQDEWDAPKCADWVARLDEAISACRASRWPQLVLAAHSAGCALVAHWAAKAAESQLDKIRAALLVAPSDPNNPNYPVGPSGFAPMPLARLPFRSTLVASTNDQYASVETAQQYADAWGSHFVLLDHAGHINVDSGFGEWPEGYALLNALRIVTVQALEKPDSSP